jgi:hypothetical protein
MMSYHRNKQPRQAGERCVQCFRICSIILQHSLFHPYGILFRRFILATSVASLAGLVFVSGVSCHLSHRDNTLVEKSATHDLNPLGMTQRRYDELSSNKQSGEPDGVYNLSVCLFIDESANSGMMKVTPFRERGLQNTRKGSFRFGV